MAKNRKGSRYRGYRKLPFTTTLALSTLGADALISGSFGESFSEERRVLSMEVEVAMQGITAGDGPLEVGIAHSDYSAAEVEQQLEATGAWDEGDKVAQEQARRLVRRLGVLTDSEDRLNDGRPVKIRLNWRIATGDTFQLWCRNRGIAMQTGTEITIQGYLHTVLV